MDVNVVTGAWTKKKKKYVKIAQSIGHEKRVLQYKCSTM